MKAEKIIAFVKFVSSATKKYTPEILTGVSIAGMFASGVMAVQATPKVIILLEKKKDELGVTELTPKETVKTAWKCYIPAAVVFVTSTLCLVGADSIHMKRNAALATVCSLSESAFKEYQNKVIETFGEKKEQGVRESISKDKLISHPQMSQPVKGRGGTTLCYDTLIDRYFWSDKATIVAAIARLNAQRDTDESVALNELYYELDLPSTKLGESLGWILTRGLIEPTFSALLDSNGNPCLVMDFINPPTYIDYAY